MAIGAISGMGNIPAYPVRVIPRVQEQEALNQQNSVSAEKITISDNQPQQTDINNRRETAPLDLQDISIGFNKNDDFSYIGKDADIASLDIQKAISDMQKDSIFQEYQYFVGSVI